MVLNNRVALAFATILLFTRWIIAPDEPATWSDFTTLKYYAVDTDRYGQVPSDICYMITNFAVVFTLRSLMMTYVFKPLALRTSTPTRKLIRVAEQAWTLTEYTFGFCFGAVRA